jgi:UDP:flavonoid glycosyltransferase YjiC (YdhE family)
VDVENVTAERLSELISQVLKDPAYRDKARYFQKVIAETNGLDKAADALEQAFQKHLKENLAPEASTLSLA